MPARKQLPSSLASIGSYVFHRCLLRFAHNIFQISLQGMAPKVVQQQQDKMSREYYVLHRCLSHGARDISLIGLQKMAPKVV